MSISQRSADRDGGPAGLASGGEAESCAPYRSRLRRLGWRGKASPTERTAAGAGGRAPAEQNGNGLGRRPAPAEQNGPAGRRLRRLHRLRSFGRLRTGLCCQERRRPAGVGTLALQNGRRPGQEAELLPNGKRQTTGGILRFPQNDRSGDGRQVGDPFSMLRAGLACSPALRPAGKLRSG